MRKYLITYWTEYRDEATDFEIEIEAESAEQAIDKFKSMRKTHKKIERVREYDNFEETLTKEEYEQLFSNKPL